MVWKSEWGFLNQRLTDGRVSSKGHRADDIFWRDKHLTGLIEHHQLPTWGYGTAFNTVKTSWPFCFPSRGFIMHMLVHAKQSEHISFFWRKIKFHSTLLFFFSSMIPKYITDMLQMLAVQQRGVWLLSTEHNRPREQWKIVFETIFKQLSGICV